jgi:hypothetical protein
MKFPWVMLGALLVAGGSSAQNPPPSAESIAHIGKPGRAAIYSADRRFMVSGMTSAENMVLAGKLAELSGKIEEKTGMSLPMQRNQILGVMVQSSASPDSQMLKMQGWDDGQFYQRLISPGALRLDSEDLMEGACWLMLNRYAAEYTPVAQRVGMGATVPDWISSGLAQNTQAALHSRNRDWIARELAEGRTMALAEVVKQAELPPGRWREKAYAAAAVEFLFPDGELNTWAMLFKAVGTRQAIDAAWLRKNCPALRDQKPELAWRGHLEERSRSRTIESWSDRGLQLEAKLLQTLNFRPQDLATNLPADVPQELFAHDLIGYRQQDWTRSIAAALSLQVQSLEIGAPPALQAVLASYAAFFDQLGTPPAEKHAWWKHPKKDPAKIQPPDDVTWQVALNQLWMRAERAHQAFLENNQSRKRYVDSFDKASPGEFDEPPPSVSDLPRTRLQKYVDEAEEKLTSP